MMVERFFSKLDHCATILVGIVDRVHYISGSSKALNILRAALAMIVDIVVDIATAVKSRRQGK